MIIFSSLGRSPGRAIVLPPASALAKSLMLKFFMWWARRCQASYPVAVTGLVLISHQNHMLWPLIWTVSLRRFSWGVTTCFYAKLTKIIPNYHEILPLIWSSAWTCTDPENSIYESEFGSVCLDMQSFLELHFLYTICKVITVSCVMFSLYKKTCNLLTYV